MSDWSSDVCSSDLVGSLIGVRNAGGRTNGTGRRRCVHRTLRSCGLTSFIAASISCSPSHESTTQESDMATGWAGDGAGQDQIDETVKDRSEEHTSELQSPMRISYAVLCLNKKNSQQERN